MYPKLRQIAALLTVAVTVAACAFTPHDLNLQPQVTLPPSSVGAGTNIFFRLVDDRDDSNVGYRGAAGQGAEITAPTLPATVETQLKQGLQNKGYHLADSERGSDATVTFSLRSFKFGVETGLLAGSDNVSAVISVDAHHNSLSYSNVYRFNSARTAIAVPAGDDLDMMMNAALNDLLNQALSDAKLDSFLTQK